MKRSHLPRLFRRRIALRGLAAVAAPLTVLGLAVSAQAQDTHTLNGSVYADPNAPETIANSLSYISSNSPVGTFTATEATLTGAGYSSGGGNNIVPFLAADGGSYVGPNSSLDNTIFDMTGYLDVTAADTYNFSVTSDDGAAMFIDGTEVVNNDGDHSSSTASGSATLGQGFHAIDLVYFEDGGVANLTTSFGGLALTTAPEPSQWAGLGLGTLGLGVLGLKASRRRRLNG